MDDGVGSGAHSEPLGDFYWSMRLVTKVFTEI
jgi:hypothetical protein